MTSLLDHLVERSVRSRPPAVFGAVAGRDDRLAADAEVPSPDPQVGVIRPRLRSRHERALEFAPAEPDTLLSIAQMQEWLPSREAAPAQADEPLPASATQRDAPRRSVALNTKPTAASPAVVVAARPRVGERRNTQPPAPAMTDPVAVAADEAPSPPDRDRATVHHVPRVAREDRQMTPQAISETAERAQPTRRSSMAQMENASPSESGRPHRGFISPVSRMQAADVERPAPAQDRFARQEDAGVLRAPTAISPIVAPRPAAAPSMPPRIEVTIGRVEVRAVYAPPSQAPARKPPSPSTSLDDYLKQRDKAG